MLFFSCFNPGAVFSKMCRVDLQSVCNGTVVCPGLDFCDIGCPNVFRCAAEKCVSRDLVCDGRSEPGCDDDDKWATGVGFKCVRNGKMCKLPQALLYDEVQDCDAREDFCFFDFKG